MTILIGIAVVVLATFVLAYFASRTWHWAYVLVVVGIVLSTAGFFILSAEVLRNNAVLRKSYNKTQKDLDDVNARIAALQHGSSDAKVIGELRGMELKVPEDASSIASIAELDHKIRLLTQARGPMWKNVTPAGFDQPTGTVRISVEAPTPPGIVANSVVYVFEAGDPALPDPRRGKQYLGEFRVREAAGQTAVLLPALEMSDYQYQRLAASRGPWVMYETMPPDRHELFAGMSEEDLRKRIPEGSLEEYIRHGKPPVADDDETRKAAFDDQGKPLKRNADGRFPADATVLYQRRLRDYAQEFRKLAQRRAVMLTDKEGLELDNQRLVEALASAQKLTAFRQDEITKLNKDLAGLAKDRQVLDTLTGQVQQQLDAVRTMLIQLIQENGRLAHELAAQQASVTNSLNQIAPAASNPLAVGRIE